MQNPKIQASFIFVLLLLSVSAKAGERSFAYPMNVAKSRLLVEAAKVIVPGSAPLLVPFNQFDFSQTRFSDISDPMNRGYAIDADVVVDGTYHCSARVVVDEKGTVFDFKSVGKVFCGLLEPARAGAN